MSLEKILKKIAEDAQVEADTILHEARRKAKEIKEKAQKEASELAEALIKEAERQSYLEASRLITEARLEKKVSILSEKRAIVEEVLDRAFERSGFESKDLKKIIILRDKEKEESYDKAKLKDELRIELESEIIEALKI